MFHKLIVLLSLVDFLVCSEINMTDPPDFVQIVSDNGYSAESHQVVTSDGYNLTFYRMTGSPSSPAAPKKPVVVLQHGFYSSSDFFVFLNHSDSLSYLLCDAGYDIWVTNIRGNTHGRSHQTLSPEDQAFWNFTLQDIATKDLPAMIDYILEKTNKPNLTYIGHSMGSSLSYILLSELPQYNEKINYLISLAPIAFFYHTSISSFQRFELKFIILAAEDFLGVRDFSAEIVSQYNTFTEWERRLCSKSITPWCADLMNEWYRTSGTTFTNEEIRNISQYAPAGSSLRILEHYRQIINDGAFKKFDYGSDERNMLAYNSTHSPHYDISKITSQVSLIFVQHDRLANIRDVQLLANNLTNLVSVEPVPSPIFRHADFFFFKGGKKLIHERILQLVNKYHQ